MTDNNPRGVTPLYGAIYGFSPVLIINRISILAELGYFGHKWGMFLKRSHFFAVIEKKINKCPSQIMFMVKNIMN